MSDVLNRRLAVRLDRRRLGYRFAEGIAEGFGGPALMGDDFDLGSRLGDALGPSSTREPHDRRPSRYGDSLKRVCSAFASVVPDALLARGMRGTDGVGTHLDSDGKLRQIGVEQLSVRFGHGGTAKQP